MAEVPICCSSRSTKSSFFRRKDTSWGREGQHASHGRAQGLCPPAHLPAHRPGPRVGSTWSVLRLIRTPMTLLKKLASRGLRLLLLCRKP